MNICKQREELSESCAFKYVSNLSKKDCKMKVLVHYQKSISEHLPLPSHPKWKIKPFRKSLHKKLTFHYS